MSASYPFPVGLQVDGVSYLLQEIYGIENKYNTQDSKVPASTPQFFQQPFAPSPSTGLATKKCSRQEFAAWQHRTASGMHGFEGTVLQHQSCQRQKAE